MNTDKNNINEQPESMAEGISPENDAVSTPDSEAEDTTVSEEMQRIETLQQQLSEAKAAVEKKKTEYLFLMADFDNFRKRVVKEKAEILRNGAEKVLAGLLPIVDDFERGLQATEGTDSADGVREGMELIYNKLIKYLADNGVKPIESTGADFNADFHEAIAAFPAPNPELKGKVVDTVQKGYMINDKVLRHAKVAVGE